MPISLDAWLAQGDAPEADWGGHVLRLALKGGLARLDDGLLLDLPALAQPFDCRPGVCAPGRRAEGVRSCCADIDVEPTPDEAAAIAGASDEVAAWMAARDDRWEGGAPPVLEGGVLTRPGGRCVFARSHRGGLRCGLHEVEDTTGRVRGALKPLPCRLFPLVVVDLGDGRRLLTAVTKRTARHVGLPSVRAFACLGGTRPPLYRSVRATIEELLGEGVYAGLRAAVVSWRRG